MIQFEQSSPQIIECRSVKTKDQIRAFYILIIHENKILVKVAYQIVVRLLLEGIAL